ncbi:MAG TPA: hypothetical protein VL043_12380, partial [Protaetiibacter sp.]|nr:hypothetical protein [Protaetiibacter sp.]
MSTITLDDERKIATWLDEHPVLAVGVGDRESACSIAAINLALTGELTDEIPECMSPTIGRWIIRVQDAMPDDIRNSAEWRSLLPRAAGTGRDLEEQRRAIILDWMWGTVLPSLQDLADEHGFGLEWRMMTTERTAEAATTAKAAAWAAWAAWAEAAAAAA